MLLLSIGIQGGAKGVLQPLTVTFNRGRDTELSQGGEVGKGFVQRSQFAQITPDDSQHLPIAVLPQARAQPRFVDCRCQRGRCGRTVSVQMFGPLRVAVQQAGSERAAIAHVFHTLFNRHRARGWLVPDRNGVGGRHPWIIGSNACRIGKQCKPEAAMNSSRRSIRFLCQRQRFPRRQTGQQQLTTCRRNFCSIGISDSKFN